MRYSRVEDLLEAILFDIKAVIYKKIVKIEVTKVPNKTSYNNGDIIDFSGLEVSGFADDGSFVKLIPFEELFFPVNIVNKNNQ